MLGNFIERASRVVRATTFDAGVVVMLAFVMGLASVGCGSSDHAHSGEQIESGKVSEARIDDSIARDNEVNQLPGGIASLRPIGFSVPEQLPSEWAFMREGSTTVTTNDDQWIVASAQAPIGLYEWAGPFGFFYAICVQREAGGPIFFLRETPSYGELTNSPVSWSAVGTGWVDPGTWRVGFCASTWGRGSRDIDSCFECGTGWVQVVNWPEPATATTLREPAPRPPRTLR
jgi:hypothetical protein